MRDPGGIRRTISWATEDIFHSLQNFRWSHSDHKKLAIIAPASGCSPPHYASSPPCAVCVRRLFGGLVLDIKRKAPFYLSDFKDGMSLQCVASFLFLYCACMSPVITFGGLLGEATEGRIVSAQTHKHSGTQRLPDRFRYCACSWRLYCPPDPQYALCFICSRVP